MTTLPQAGARRAFSRLTASRSFEQSLEPSEPPAARPARWTWRHVRLPLPLPAVTDSRRVRAVLSTGARPELARALDLAAIVAAAVGAVALVSVLCR